MNPATLLSMGVSAAIVWSLLDDFEKARVKQGLSQSSSPTWNDAEPMALVQDYNPVVQSAPSTITQIEPTPEPAPIPKTFEERKASLISLFKEQNLLTVWELRNATPLRFSGWQRSGKSTKAQVVALLRQVDNLSHPVTVCTPHHLTPGDKEWSDSFRVVGQGNKWGDIRHVIDKLQKRLASGDCTPITTILDEFSGYAGEVGDDDYIQKLMMSAVREMAKHKEMFMLIAHGNTMAMNGNIRGLSQAMWGNFVTVHCHREMVDGLPYPSPKVQVSGGGFPSRTIHWPDWLTPEWVLSQFPELESIKPQNDADTVPTLGTVSKPSATPVDSELAEVEAHLQSILDYLAKKGTATPRQIQQAKLSGLAKAGITKSEQIQVCLDTLVYQGRVTIPKIDTYQLISGVTSETP